MIKSTLLVILIIISLPGCENKIKTPNVEIINKTSQDSSLWEDQNSLYDFYEFCNSINVRARSKASFMKDSMFLCEWQTAHGGHLNVYTINNSRVIQLKERYFASYLDNSNKYFSWEQINKQNIKLFFGYFIAGYQDYGYEDIYTNVIPEFPQMISEYHNFKYLITEDLLTFVFWFIAQTPPVGDIFKFTVQVNYNRHNGEIKADTLKSIEVQIPLSK